jgi:hypothetical protein
VGTLADQIRILSWPFHNGLRNVSMGRGAARLAADAELRADIEEAGWTVTHDEIDPVDEGDPEVARVIELIRRLAAAVKRAVDDGGVPLVLAGNCNSALATTGAWAPTVWAWSGSMRMRTSTTRRTTSPGSST